MRTKTVKITDGSTLCITVTSPRIISVSPIKEKYEIRDNDGKLIGLDFCGDIIFNTDETIKIHKQKFKILYIEKEFSPEKGGPAYLLKTQKRISKTSMYIMPFLGYNRHYFNWQSSFVNAFIGTQQDGDYGSSIYLLFRFSSDFGFEEKLELHPNYIETLDPDPYHTLYQFNIPEEYAEDVGLILEGKYSEISLGAKNQILDFHNSRYDRPLGQILSKSEDRRRKMEIDLGHPIPKGNELLDRFTIEEEVFMNKFIIQEDDRERESAPEDSGVI